MNDKKKSTDENRDISLKNKRLSFVNRQTIDPIR